MYRVILFRSSTTDRRHSLLFHLVPENSSEKELFKKSQLFFTLTLCGAYEACHFG